MNLLQLDFESDSIDFKNTDLEFDDTNSIKDLNVSYEEVKTTFDINEDDIEKKEVETKLNED